MHNNSALHRSSGGGAVVVPALSSVTPPARNPLVRKSHDAASPTPLLAPRTRARARSAKPSDAPGIAALIASYTADGSLLPRSEAEILATIDSFVVVTDTNGAVLACAALQEYSPSLAELGAVAVAREAQGHGLGSIVVRAVERLAKMRGHRELFAISLADHFFGYLGYRSVTLEKFPEKIARYDALRERGTTPAPKRCFRKRLRVMSTSPRAARSARAAHATRETAGNRLVASL